LQQSGGTIVAPSSPNGAYPIRQLSPMRTAQVAGSQQLEPTAGDVVTSPKVGTTSAVSGPPPQQAVREPIAASQQISEPLAAYRGSQHHQQQQVSEPIAAYHPQQQISEPIAAYHAQQQISEPTATYPAARPTQNSPASQQPSTVGSNPSSPSSIAVCVTVATPSSGAPVVTATATPSASIQRETANRHGHGRLTALENHVRSLADAQGIPSAPPGRLTMLESQVKAMMGNT